MFLPVQGKGADGKSARVRMRKIRQEGDRDGGVEKPGVEDGVGTVLRRLLWVEEIDVFNMVYRYPAASTSDRPEMDAEGAGDERIIVEMEKLRELDALSRVRDVGLVG